MCSADASICKVGALQSAPHLPRTASGAETPPPQALSETPIAANIRILFFTASPQVICRCQRSGALAVAPYETCQAPLSSPASVAQQREVKGTQVANTVTVFPTWLSLTAPLRGSPGTTAGFFFRVAYPRAIPDA